MIHPNTVIYSKRPSNLKSRSSVDVIKLPLEKHSSDSDRGVIDQIRSQPKPNDINKYTISPFSNDIQHMVKLLGSYCKKNSINEISNYINQIHEDLNSKEAPEIKNWLRILTGLHPDIDKKIKKLGYWQMPYSEVMGTNTVLYYAGPDAVDITNWAKTPRFTTNDIEWFTEVWESPHYIRESLRQKIDSPAVEMIQNANHTTTKYLRRNLIWESLITTKPVTGGEVAQIRPIMPIVPIINHGASLNNDWYHQTYRIMNGPTMDKHICKHDIICHLTSNGYYVHLLVNHLTPLLNNSTAQDVNAKFIYPIGIEETFPRRSISLVADIDNSGQKVLKKPLTINNDVLKPEIIEGE